MTRVKICGLTSREDALWAAECGADALGFVFEPSSPRYVSPERLRAVDALLDVPFVVGVAVYGRLPDGWVAPPADLDIVQTTTVMVRRRWFQVLRVSAGDSTGSLLKKMETLPDAVVLDAFVAGQEGGSGQTIDWGLAAEFVQACPRPVVLAGGLTCSNVAPAIRQVRPYAVDVSSGVEASPGVKDPDLVRAFLAEAKGA